MPAKTASSEMQATEPANVRSGQAAKRRTQFSLRSLLLAMLLAASLGLLWWPGKGSDNSLVAGFPYSAWHGAFSQDGRFAGASSGGGEVAIWNLEHDNKMVGFKAHGTNVRYCGFSPDGNLFITASDDGTAALWNPDDGALKRKFTGHTNTVNYAILSSDSKYLLTGSDDDTVRLWDARSGTELLRLTLRQSRDAPIAFSPDAKHIVLPDAMSNAVIVDLATLAPVRALGTGKSFYVTYSPDGSRVLTMDFDGTVRVYDAQAGTLAATLAGSFPCYHGACFSPDGKRIGAAEKSGAGIWDAATGKRLTLLENRNGDLFQSPTFSPDGKKVVAIGRAAYDGGMWNSETGRLLRDLPHTVWLGFTPKGNQLAWVKDGGNYELGMLPDSPKPQPTQLERPEYWLSLLFGFGLLASMWFDRRPRKQPATA